MEAHDSKSVFPIVSIGPLTEKYINGDTSLDKIHDDQDSKHILKQITEAFTGWGFVYLIDHGIEPTDAFKVSKEFFEKERNFKCQYMRTSNEDFFGYVPFALETFDKNRPFDLKECFNFFTPHHLVDESDDKIKELMDIGMKFSDSCRVLTNMLLRIMSPALDQSDKNFLLRQHQHIGNINSNKTTLRMLYYPAIKNDKDILEKQLRCGEHSDYGTITLLFQDNAGGLQVVSPTGEYVDAVPVPGSIVVNVADLMEVWTSGKFKSTRHRVVIRNRHQIARQSIAYFVYPDDDAEVSCLDGSNKFKPVNAYEYLMKKFSDIY